MHSAARASLGSLIVLFSIALPTRAQGWIIPRPCGMAVGAADARVVLPLRDCRPNIVRTKSDVRVDLDEHVLHYEVEERFVNHGAAVGEADYVFPLPNGAAFQDLKLSINGEMVAGETMNAADARGIYERIVRAQRDPALVEWMGHGMLRARIFPLNPGEEKRIVVRFQSVAPREGDALRVDYFRGGGSGAAGTTSTIRDGGGSSFTLSYKPSAQLGAPYSPTHSIDLAERDGRRVATVRGDARDVTLLVPLRRASAAAIAMLPYAPGNEDGFALVTVTPPLAVRGEATPRDITLVLDVSGSMQGPKMEQARAAGRQLLGTLRPEDRFRLIDFSSDVRTFRDDFVAATAGNLRDAAKYLDALEAQGGTNIEGALREAVRPQVAAGRLPMVLFVTDGEATVGEQRTDQLAAIAADGSRRGAAHRIFTFGLGSDVNVSLLEQLAIDGRGTSQFVRPDESVERMVGIVANRLVDPVLTDVRVRIEGDVRFSKVLPAQSADVFADRDLVVLARYSGHGSARVIVEGTRRGEKVEWTTSVDFPERERQNPFVARLWAAQRVGFLSAEKRKRGSTELDEEIRMLGERYGIPTEFTSYLVTEPRAMASRMSPAAGASFARTDRFEQAKMASAQRALQSIAVMDSVRAASPVSSTPAKASPASTSTRRIDGRSFTLTNGVWTDGRYHQGMVSTTIRAYSRAYFDLIDKLPELRSPFALGDHVIVAGRDRAIIVADGGASELGAAELGAIVRGW